MYYRVKRKDDNITFVDIIEKKETIQLNRSEYIHIEDEVLDVEIRSMLKKGLTVSFNIITKKLESKVDKYYDIPKTDVKRVQAIKRANLELTSITNQFELIDYVSYIDCNNVLCSHGFFITEDNREDMYISILEDGNDKIIDSLEEFLTLKDKLNKVKSAKRNFDKSLEKIYNTSEADMDNI